MWTEIRQLWSQGFMKGSRRDKVRKTLNKRPKYLFRSAVFSLTCSCWNPDIFHSINQKRDHFFFFKKENDDTTDMHYTHHNEQHMCPWESQAAEVNAIWRLPNLRHYLVAACSCSWSSANASRYKSGSLLRWKKQAWGAGGRGEPYKLRKFYPFIFLFSLTWKKVMVTW